MVGKTEMRMGVSKAEQWAGWMESSTVAVMVVLTGWKSVDP